MEETLKSLRFLAKRALREQTPETSRAYSFEIHPEKKLIRLRAHFAQPLSEDDIEVVSVGETEIEVVAPGTPLSFLSGGVAYLRQGEAGTICSE